MTHGYFAKKQGVVSPRIDNRRGNITADAGNGGPNKPKIGSNYTTSKSKRPEDNV